MLPDRVSNPGPLTYESGALPIALRGPAGLKNPEFELKTGLDMGWVDLASEFSLHFETGGVHLVLFLIFVPLMYSGI